jgi:hypothetical protein
MKLPAGRERLLVAGALALVVLVVFAWSQRSLSQAESQFAVIREGGERTVALAREVVRLQAAPARALEIAPQDLNPAAMVAEAAARSGVPASAVKRIETLPPRPLGRGDAATVETNLTLDGLSMKQAVELLLYIQKNHPAWSVRSLRLMANSADKSLWNVNCTLVTTLYTPGLPKEPVNEPR